MRIGISTACYYPDDLDLALRKVVEGGAECTEIFINSFTELTPAFVREMRAILRSGDTRVVSVHPFTSAWEPMLFFGDYERRFTDGLDIYARYAEVTAELGGEFVVLHGAFDRHPVPPESYVDSYARLHEYIRHNHGVKLAQENVGRCMSRDPSLLLLLRQAIPDISFVLDIKQTFRGIGGMDDVLEAMGDRIAHLHYSDARVDCDCLPLGAGDFDFDYLLRRLAAIGYKGDAVLELYRHSYEQESQLWDSIDIMQKLRKFTEFIQNNYDNAK